jgi:hypothetical protein
MLDNLFSGMSLTNLPTESLQICLQGFIYITDVSYSEKTLQHPYLSPANLANYRTLLQFDAGFISKA